MQNDDNGSGRIHQTLSVLNTILHLGIVGLVALLCSLPVLTLGISLAAMYSTVRRIQTESEGANILAAYFTEWSASLHALGWVGFAIPVVLAAMAASWYCVFVSRSAALLILVVFCTLFALNVLLYLFILNAYFESPIQSMLISAGKLALTRFFPGVGAVILQTSSLILSAAAPRLFLILIPLLAVLGLSAPAYCILSINRPLINYLSKDGSVR